MRVQDNILLTSAAAWNIEHPSAFPRLHKYNSNVAKLVGSIACAASRRHVLGRRRRWRQPGHATVSDQVEHRS
jgi:hypothetical protein